MYPDSEIAGMASLAALEQGKFPEMHTLLMQAEGTFNESSLEKIASEAGLDIKSFREAMKSERIKARIEEDMDLAMTITAKGTPNFYINGRKITGLIPLEDFKTVIEIEKNKALDMISKGVTTQELYNRLIQGGIKISPLGPDKQEINISSSPAAGNPDADYKFIIFSDFASPLSKRAAESLNELFKVYGNKMCLYFKHFPLDVHKEASVAAIASTCAHQQNKFFQYHDMLFQNQNDLSLSALQSYAEKIGMDMLKFNQCILEQKTNSIILEDIKEGKALNIRTVPALFINGRQFIPALGWGKEDIQRVIERYLKN
jgi:protein-disulfide isomerase